MVKSKSKKRRRATAFKIDNLKTETLGVLDESYEHEARAERIEKLIAKIILLGLDE